MFGESQNLLDGADAGGFGPVDTEEEKLKKIVRAEIKRALDPAIDDIKNHFKKQYTGIDKKVSSLLPPLYILHTDPIFFPKPDRRYQYSAPFFFLEENLILVPRPPK